MALHHILDPPEENEWLIDPEQDTTSTSSTNNSNNEIQDEDDNSEIQRRIELFNQFFGSPPQGLWDYYTYQAEYMNQSNLDTAPTASDSPSSDDSSYSEQSVSDSTPIIKIYDILSNSSTSEKYPEDESTSSHETMPPLMDINEEEDSSIDNDSDDDQSTQSSSTSSSMPQLIFSRGCSLNNSINELWHGT